HDPPFRITASFGVAALTAQRESSETWLAHADAALYDAKRSGRNCIRRAAMVPETIAA
ncbi:MAG: diguanylate cyclase, partial [Rhodospirillaceae bacterium]|nr:diguanylate cyclase [Rhodospirillaceae bacterium]